MLRPACWIDADIWITGSQSSVHTRVEEWSWEGRVPQSWKGLNEMLRDVRKPNKHNVGNKGLSVHNTFSTTKELKIVKVDTACFSLEF